MESTVTKFANFIEKSIDIEIPDSTLHSAKLIVADCLGAIVGGMAEPEIRMLAESKGENLFEILDNNKKATDERLKWTKAINFAKAILACMFFQRFWRQQETKDVRGKNF